MYGGFVGACYGSMCADFGMDAARHLIHIMAKNMQTLDPRPEVH